MYEPGLDPNFATGRGTTFADLEGLALGPVGEALNEVHDAGYWIVNARKECEVGQNKAVG